MTQWVHDIAGAWWSWMAGMSAQLAMLVIVVAVLDRAVARWAWPQLLSALWYVAIVKLVVPPSVCSPFSVAHLLPEDTLARHATDPGMAGGVIVAGFSVWLLGAVSLGAIMIWRHRRLTRAWLSGPAMQMPAWLETLASDAAQRLRMRRVPDVCVQGRAAGPAVVGFFRPVVVVPSSLVHEADSGRLAHVLLHEFAHVKRRDHLAALLCVAVQLVYWFHPLVWITRARLGALREVCCDHTVAATLGGATQGYRRTLLEAGRRLIEPEPGALLGFIHRHSQLLGRLRWLERPLPRWSTVRKSATVLVFCLMALSCVPLGVPAVPVVDSVPPQDIPGCLQLRYMVFEALAAQEAPPGDVHPPI